MNINEAKAIIAQLNNLPLQFEKVDEVDEAVKLAIRTAIEKPGELYLGTAYETTLNTFVDYSFKKMDLEIGTYLREDNTWVSACIIHSHLLDDGGLEFSDISFDAIVANVIEMDERNIRARELHEQFKKEKKQLKEKVDLVVQKVQQMNNGLNDKVAIKVNQLNTIDISVSNISEEALKKIIEKLEEIQ